MVDAIAPNDELVIDCESFRFLNGSNVSLKSSLNLTETFTDFVRIVF